MARKKSAGGDQKKSTRGERGKSLVAKGKSVSKALKSVPLKRDKAKSKRKATAKSKGVRKLGEARKTAKITLVDLFEQVEDPRRDNQNRHHLLTDILMISFMASIAGANTWVAVEEFGKRKLEWLSGFLSLIGGIPSHDTFGRVFSLIDPDQLADVLVSATNIIIQHSAPARRGSKTVALDGKAARRSHDRANGQSHLYAVSAWASENGLVIGQVATDEKSNEITAIPELLKKLSLKGVVVTTDAAGCQKKIAKQIISQGGDYVFALKGNQSKLQDDADHFFNACLCVGLNEDEWDMHRTEERGHGRNEVRSCFVTTNLRDLHTHGEWKGMKTLIVVDRERTIAGKTTRERQYYISSWVSSAEKLLQVIRSHWSIENSCHWVLDMAFREDESRVRIGHAQANMATLRRLALNALRKTTTGSKVGVETKRLAAAWDNDYLLEVACSLQS